jgi:hypothetical protein
MVYQVLIEFRDVQDFLDSRQSSVSRYSNALTTIERDQQWVMDIDWQRYNQDPGVAPMHGPNEK